MQNEEIVIETEKKCELIKAHSLLFTNNIYCFVTTRFYIKTDKFSSMLFNLLSVESFIPFR